MKEILLIVLFSLLGISSFGQKIKFSDSSNIWKGYNWSNGALIVPISDPYTYAYSGDTIIHSINYKILRDALSISSVSIYIREDTVIKKVFAIMTEAPDNDTTEQLLYDYTLNIGDTMRTNHVEYYVSAKDSVVINALSYHVWHLNPFSVDSVDRSIGTMTDFDVIEGIGCINDPRFPLRPFTFEAISNLTCFNNEGTTPVLSRTIGPYFNNTTSCSLVLGPLSTNKIVAKNENINLFPNPANKELTIISTTFITTVSISNLFGQTEYNNEYNSEHVQIDIANLPSGVYFVRINGTEVRKFVKE